MTASDNPGASRRSCLSHHPVEAGFVLGLLLAGIPCRAQEAPPSGAALAIFQGGVPSGAPSSEELPLTLKDAIERGLRSNLGAILGASAVDAAEASRRAATADLLPQLRAGVSEARLKINLEAFGLTLPGVPPLVGPFNVFDARAYLQQSLLDLHALHRRHAASDSLEASSTCRRSPARPGSPPRGRSSRPRTRCSASRVTAEPPGCSPA